MTDPYETAGIAKNWVRRALVLAFLALSGCAGPTFVQNPESGIELRWPKGAGDIGEAQAMAGTHCPRGAATLGSITGDSDETLAGFTCD